jgi:hypothetical protein
MIKHVVRDSTLNRLRSELQEYHTGATPSLRNEEMVYSKEMVGRYFICGGDRLVLSIISECQ